MINVVSAKGGDGEDDEGVVPDVMQQQLEEGGGGGGKTTECWWKLVESASFDDSITSFVGLLEVILLGRQKGHQRTPRQ